MTHKHRHRFGEPEIRQLPVNSNIAIEVGEILYLETDDVRPATEATQSALAGTREYVHDRFAGVSVGGHELDDAIHTTVGVAQAGVFEFTAAAGTYNHGDLVTCGAGAGAAVLSGTVVKVADGNENLAIGKVVGQYGVNPATVNVKILPVKGSAGGAQAPA